MKDKRIEDKVRLICDFLDKHPEKSYSLDELSHRANISKFHFQRVFTSIVGVSPSRYKQFSRMRRASMQLVYVKDLKIIDIALSAGFENPESFSRSFTKLFGQSPKDFRNNPNWSSWGPKFNFSIPTQTKKYNITIKKYPDRPCAMITHYGDYLQTIKSFDKLFSWITKNKIMSTADKKKLLVPISIPSSNPFETDPDDYQCKLALPYNGNISSNNLGIYSEKIPGGTYAIIKYEGQRDIYGFLHAITFFFVDWLPHSGWNKMNDQILIEHLNSPLDVDETKLITHICIPICK